jgi:L-fucose isomerase-like protein
MLTILPLASTLNPPEQIHATVGRLSARLGARGIAHEIVAPGGREPGALLIVTGGTEHLALAALDATRGPALLVAHPEQNSFPAALEILSRLRQTGRPGRIALLNDHDDGWALLARLAACQAARARLAAMRIGRIGAASDWLVASTPPVSAVRDAWGPELVDVPMADVRRAMAGADAADVTRIVRDFVDRAEGVREPNADDLATAARVACALREVVRHHRLDACTVRCFDLVVDDRTTGCLALSWLLDEGIVAGCEGDVPAALTMAWLQLMAGEPGFIANPQDIDLAAGMISLAHCTIARRMLAGYTLRSHFESSLGVGIQGRLDPGPVTLARIGGADLRALFAADGDLVSCGNVALRCRTQVDVRLQAGLRDLVERPAGNHHVLVRGHWAQRLREYHELYVALPAAAAGRG